MTDKILNENLIENVKPVEISFVEVHKEDKNNEDNHSDDMISKNHDKSSFHKKGFYDKYFSKLEPGSLRSSIFSLSILSIGIGCLALPQKFGQVSILAMTIMLIFVCGMTYITMDIIIIAARKKNLTIYAHVIEEYCGKKWAMLFDVANILFVVGIILAYQIISKYLFYLLYSI
jgi:hypothetical protein